MRRKSPGFAGQSLIEFALIIPLFIFIVLFIFDIGRAVYYYNVLYNAVREGARFAAVGAPLTNETGIQNVVVDKAFGMDLTTSDVDVNWLDGFVTISADYDYAPITPIISGLLPGNVLDMSVDASMKMEFEP